MIIGITGSRGFIGAATVRAAKTAGHEVVHYDRADGYHIESLDPYDGFGGKLGRTGRPPVDHVIHLAGVLGTAELFDDPYRAVAVNIEGALNIIRWCEQAGVGYTTITMPPSGWANVYAATKGCAVELAEAWRRHRGLRVSNVCAYNAYGPGQKYGPGHPQKIIPTFASRAWAGQPIQVWGDGNQTVDLVHADDVARMLIDATAFGDGETFDAGTGEALTVNQVADYVNEVVTDAGGKPGGIEYLPMRAGEDVDTEICAIGRGWDLVNWSPTLDWSDLRAAIESYRPAA
jgi:UDP-glucose 4-epimerase